MEKVLIVEDIPSVRTYIAQLLLEYDHSEVELAGEAANGLTALEILEREPIDILITDMFMPQMDGMQLMEKAIARQPGLKMIVISAYDHYSYVRSAMRLNACEYLLKPVSKKDFNNAMDEVLRKLHTEREEAGRLKGLMHEREIRQKSLQVKQYLEGGHVQEPWLMELKDSWKLVVMISSPVLFASPEFQRLLTADGLYAFYVSDRPIRYVALFCQTTEETVKQWIKRVMNVSVSLHLPAYFAYEVPNDQEERTLPNRQNSLLEGWRRARRKLHVRFLQKMQPDKESAFALSEKDALCLQCSLPGREEAEIQVSIGRYFDLLRQENDRTYQQVWDFFQQWQKIYLAICRNYQIDFLSSVNGCHDLTLSDCIDLDHAQQLIIQQFLQLRKRIPSENENGSAQMIRQIQKHLEKNCADEIRLHDLACMLYLSEDYLGKLFRDVTGESFSAFLTRMRMERAYSLIAQTDMKVTDVAAAVGYNSTSNFISVFKKQFGETPVSLRKHKQLGTQK